MGLIDPARIRINTSSARGCGISLCSSKKLEGAPNSLIAMTFMFRMNEPYPMRGEWTKDLFKIGGPGFQVLRTTFFLATWNIRPEYSRLLGFPLYEEA